MRGRDMGSGGGVSYDDFPEGTVAFLAGIHDHNEMAWFDAHRADYDECYVEAGKEF